MSIAPDQSVCAFLINEIRDVKRKLDNLKLEVCNALCKLDNVHLELIQHKAKSKQRHTGHGAVLLTTIQINETFHVLNRIE